MPATAASPVPQALLVGLAHSASSAQMVREAPQVFDYVEVPYEQLVHRPATLDEYKRVPLVLHCASLSLAGFVPASPEDIAAVSRTARAIGSPWVGEHLAFLTAAPLGSFGDPVPLPGVADRSVGAAGAGRSAGGVYNVGYTVAPSFNRETLDRVVTSVKRVAGALDVPLIVENSPVYFPMPDSDMTPTEFLVALCRECGEAEVGLLLDLTHLYVACENLGLDPISALGQVPLDRVVEVHISGASLRGSIMLDDHGVEVPEVVFELLGRVLATCTPRAVTVELNWRSSFPAQMVVDTAQRVRTLAAEVRQVPIGAHGAQT